MEKKLVPAKTLQEYADLLNTLGTFEEPIRGLDPTFYITLSYEKDLEIWNRLGYLRSLLDQN